MPRSLFTEFLEFFSPILIKIRQERFLWESLPIYSTYKMSFTGSLRAGVFLSGSSEKRSVHMVNSTSLCNWYRLPVASLTAGLNSVPITEKFSVMSRESLKGNAPVTIVTSVPWERERDITVIAVIAARSAKRRSVSDSDVIVAGAAFILPLELVFACFATIGQSFGLAWANRSSGKVGGKEFP